MPTWQTGKFTGLSISYRAKASFFIRFFLLVPFLTGSLWASDGASTAESLDAALEKSADFMEGIIFYSINIAGQGLPIVLVVLGGTAIFLTIYF